MHDANIPFSLIWLKCAELSILDQKLTVPNPFSAKTILG